MTLRPDAPKTGPNTSFFGNVLRNNGLGWLVDLADREDIKLAQYLNWDKTSHKLEIYLPINGVDQAHVKEVLEAFHNPNFNVDLRAVANQRGEEVFVVAIGAVAKPLTGYHSAADLSALLRSTSEPQLIAVDLHQKIFNERPKGLPAPKLPLEGMRLELLQTAPANPAQVSSPNAMVYEIGDYAALSVPSTGAVDLKEIARLATLEFGELEGRMDTTFIRSGDLRLVQFHMSREHHGDLLAFAKKLGVEELPPST